MIFLCFVLIFLRDEKKKGDSSKYIFASISLKNIGAKRRKII